MASNNDLAASLSGLSRDELLQLIIAQQSHQRTQQQHQAALAGLTQGRDGGGLSAASLLQDRLLAQQTFGGASLSGQNALSSLLASHHNHQLPGAVSSSSSQFLRLGLGETAPASGADLFDTRSRLATTSAADLTNNTIRQLMLRQELLGGAGVSSSSASVISQLMGGSGLPSDGSSEDSVLRHLTTGNSEQWALVASLVAAATPQQQQQQQYQSRGSLLGHSSAPSLLETRLTTEQLFGLANHASLPNPATLSVPAPPPAEQQQQQPQKKAAEPAAVDTEAKPAAASKKKTKRPLSAYNIFFKEEHAKIIAQNEREKAEKQARGEEIVSDEDDYCDEDDTGAAVDPTKTKGTKRKRCLSTNQPGKRGKRQVDFENLTKVIGKRWKELPPKRVEEYKRRAEEAMQTYRKSLFQKIRNSVKEDQS